MAREQVVRLFREVQLNPALRERFNLSSTPEEFVQLAQQHGYNFTVDEWRESIRFSVEELNCKLSEIPGI
jgi:predicted ribosomally synthesized peptide with nif11-like leader